MMTMGRFSNIFARRGKHQAQKENSSASVPTSNNASTTAPPPKQTSQPTLSNPPSQSSGSLNLWQTAYEELDKKERNILSKKQFPADLVHKEDVQPDILIGEIIRLTEEQYEKYQQKEGKLRESSQKIINAALSFKDIISAVAAADPTQHAASAWTIVSLGLTIAKNRSDLRDALFKSSEFLSDVLTQCAFIETKFYINCHFSIKDDLGKAIIRLYKAILHYTALVRDAQDPGMGKNLLNWVTAITEHPLTELKASINKERDNISQWIELVEHLHHEEDAENILCRIDKLADSIKNLTEQFSIVNLRVAEGALYDSYVNEHEDFCLPETRTELLSQISKWVESSDSKCLFWLKGMAGTGKSTIARTIAQSFKEKGQLGATFFFKRDEASRNNAKYLISTITRQLVTNYRQLVPDVLDAIKSDPNIASKFLSDQFDKLLYQPLLKLRLNQPTTMVFVIDALDECERKDDIHVILQLLFRLQEIRSVHLRIFLTSRPELSIRLGFKQNKNHQDLVLHELPKPEIERDIRLYLVHKLSIIRDGRSLSTDWPGKDELESLVKAAVPLFIFAATACHFIKEGTHPKKRLQKLLDFQATTSASQMSKIYLPVLEQLIKSEEDDPTELLKEFQDIVGVIILLATPLSVKSLSRLLQLPAEDISEVLDRLHSVLSIPNDREAPVRILHLSFRDYLLNIESRFRVNGKETHGKIVSHCLHVMDTKLKHNICDLPSYGTQRKDINSQDVNKHLSADLQYSCSYWVHHLHQSKGCIPDKVFSFLKRHFLHWLEALSLMGAISEAVGMIDMLQAAVGNTNAEIADFMYDAKRFVVKNRHIASIAPLQLYCSGLTFAPMQSTIKGIFCDEIPKQILILPRVERSWSPQMQTLEGHSGFVGSVVFSGNGQMLASGSKDQTIKLWDTKTGAEVQTLRGHSGVVWSVAFSDNRQMLASGSDDHTVKIWDTKTGAELQTLNGHSDQVRSVAFSGNGQMLASGSDDHTIKLWDTKTGAELQTLKGHRDLVVSVSLYDGHIIAFNGYDDYDISDDYSTVMHWKEKIGAMPQMLRDGRGYYLGSVCSVAFSGDGQMLASGSTDHTIKLWDTKTGAELQTLWGHSAWVTSVAFSGDGQMLASGSEDHIIKLWDTKTGAEVQTLRGHSSLVMSVAFSGNGQMLASGSDDHTIKLWDTKTGAELQAPKGHSGFVRSVAFSGNRQMLASGSDDHTIKLWDTKTGAQLRTLKGHSGCVTAVAFSGNGQMLASSSDDHTIKLWDTKTGAQLRTLKGHSGWVTAVAFSGDGQMLASGSQDCTIKLWDTQFRSELQTLKGHLGTVTSLAFSGNGQMLASGSADHTIKLWDIKTGAELHMLKGHLEIVTSVAFSGNGWTLASGSADHTIKLWDTKTGAQLQTLKGHSGRVRSVAFSGDGQMLASGSQDHTIKLWDIKTGAELKPATDTLHAEGYISTKPSSIPLLPGSVTNNIRVSVSDQWVTLSGQNFLWLPPDYRHFRSSALKGDYLALGYDDGRVSILGFYAL